MSVGTKLLRFHIRTLSKFNNFPTGTALMKVVEVYREIQDQQMNIVSFDCVYPALLILDSSLILNSKRGMPIIPFSNIVLMKLFLESI